MEKIQIEYTHEGAVARVVLKDGKGNVLDNAMMLELLDLLEQFGRNKDVKIITFEGAGKHFSFGASVEEHTRELAETMLKTFHKIFYRIIELGIPTLARISGKCLGGGMELALVCNFLFGDRTAVLGQPEVALGVFAPPASIMLPLKIGNARAEELLITGRNIQADEAKAIGLLHDVYADKATLQTETDKWIETHILPKSASSLRYAVKASRTTFNYIMGNKLPSVEYIYLSQLMATKDANEGIRSFLEKRQPIWENC